MTTIPTLDQLYTQIKSDLETEFQKPIPIFGKVFLRALAAVQAAKLWLWYLLLGKVQKNVFIDTADPEATGGTLERFGRIKLGRNPFPAQAGQYVVTVTGTAGATIPAQTTFKSNDDSLSPGIQFILDSAHVMAGTSDQITLRSLTAGTAAKLLAGNGLTANAPIANVNKTATVVSESVQPLDAEDLEDYRAKAEEAYQLEPNGGAPSDFRLWAKDAQGVKQAYAYARSGEPAEVDLYIEANPADSTDGFGTPSALILSEVESVVELDPDTTKPIDDRGRRPLGVWQVHYLPVTIKTVDIDIAGFQGLTVDIQNTIFNAIEAMVNNVRPFVAGADILESKNDILSTNSIISAILSVRPGSIFGTVTLRVNGVSVPSFTFLRGDIPHLNTVNYV